MRRYRRRGGIHHYGEKKPGAALPVLMGAAAAAVCCGLYYRFGITAVFFIGLGAAVLIGSIVSLAYSKNYDMLLVYSASAIVCTAAGYALIFLALARWLPVDETLYWLPVFYLLIVETAGTLVRIFSGSRQLKNFNRFFLAGCIILGTVYLGALIYLLLAPGIRREPADGSMGWIPFASLSEYIEDAIRGVGDAGRIVEYIVPRILIYVPFGFYISVILGKNTVILRFPLILLLPIGIEWAQWQFQLGRADIDDVIFGVIGGIAGVLLYYVLNAVSRACAGRSLLERESTRGSFGWR
ncbi:MAG TPA: VanZ family protein [Candidatus Caccomorpha excrementavium]|nr:VanZ family protein [Candidatus Caccomorpha excrementavium]